MADTLREAAEGLPKILDDAAHWIEACPFENALPHATLLVNKGLEIEAALASPDPVAEARVVIGNLLVCFDARDSLQWGEAIQDARDWLKRNGGAE